MGWTNSNTVRQLEKFHVPSASCKVNKRIRTSVIVRNIDLLQQSSRVGFHYEFDIRTFHQIVKRNGYPK